MNSFTQKTKALVLLSGGQDSTTCLFLALRQFDEVHAIAFDYGQKQVIELELCKGTCEQFEVPLKIVNIKETLYGSALTDHSKDTSAPSEQDKDLPSTFTAGRNALFLTIAASHAYNLGINTLITGVCQTDYSGYPDCRRVFIDSMEVSLSLAMNRDFVIITPLMYIDKASTFLLASEMGVLDHIRVNTHTCYNGDRTELHTWGYGCGKCPACTIRKEGYKKFLMQKQLA